MYNNNHEKNANMIHFRGVDPSSVIVGGIPLAVTAGIAATSTSAGSEPLKNFARRLLLQESLCAYSREKFLGKDDYIIRSDQIPKL